MYVLDLRGHGRSAWATTGYQIPDYGRDLAAFLQQVVGRPAIVLGHSLGGLATTWLAACVPVSRETGPVAQIPTLAVQPVDTAVPPTATLTPTETAVPPTATATVEVTAVPINDPAPVNRDPIVITNDFTNVRRGPGLAYEVSHVLSVGATAPILGRNDDDSLSGMSDGQPCKRVGDELHSWSAELPATQDYLLTVAAPADAATTGYRIFLTIDRLETP